MSAGSAYSQLCRKHQQTVDAFVRCGVQSDAYTEVYGPTKRPDTAASRLFSKPLVQQAVQERTDQAVARAGVRNLRVLEEIAAIAFIDPGELFNDDNSLKPVKDLPDNVRRAILAIETDELFDGVGREREKIGVTRKLKLQPKLEALTRLGQYLKLFVERHELSGPNGGAIPVKDVSDLDKARRVAFLLAQGLREAQAVQPTEATGSSTPESGNPAGSPPAHSTKQENNS
ncbi:MAG: terminase small subunit [Steroidobacteraceae bacterium]